MPLLTNKLATSNHPQVVTVIVDDSHSMQDPGEPGRSKAQIVTESLQDMVMATQSGNQGSKGFRFLWNIAKFGSGITPIAEAQPPGEISLEQLIFKGESGWTNMAGALEWAAAAVEKALAVCRALPAYDEAGSPPPLVLFLGDGENTADPVDSAAEKLRSIKFKDGQVNVIACGIGMKQEHFGVMKTVASKPEFAVNISPAQVAELLASVGATWTEIKPIILEFDTWDQNMAKGRSAVENGNFSAAETAFTTALAQARTSSDHRLPLTLTELTNLHVGVGDWAKALPFCMEALSLVAGPGPSIALPGCVQAAEGVAEILQIADQTPAAQDLWTKIAAIWEEPGAAKWVERAGKWSAFGFRDLALGRAPEAAAKFHRALDMGGAGSAAAAKALAAINITNSTEATEPFLEKLVDLLAARLGPINRLTAKAVGDLRGVYLLQGKNEKAALLKRRFQS